VSGEAVRGVYGVVLHHDPIPRHFGDDGCRGDGGFRAIAPNDVCRWDGKGKVVTSVNAQEPWGDRAGEIPDRAEHGFVCCGTDPLCFNEGVRDDPNAERAVKDDPFECPLPLPRRQLLAVGDEEVPLTFSQEG